MKALIVLLLIVFAFMGGGYYYQNYYPPSVLKREAKKSLNEFAASVATKDRAQISAALQKLLTDDAKIHLEVSFFAGITNETPPSKQDFDKKSFIAFIDNILYSLTDYSYQPTLTRIDASRRKEGVAPVEFTSNDWADGKNFFAGVGVDMRFTTNVECKGNTRFDPAIMHIQLSSANCAVHLRSIPKPGQATKFNNMETIQDMLMKQTR